MLTLITVNYNCATKTLDLLRSLEAQSEKNFDVIVVDNDSASEDRALLGEYASSSKLRLDIIYSETNRGFSGGNNLAIRKALAQESQWLLLINNDTTVLENFIADTRKQLGSESAIVGLPMQEKGNIAYAGRVVWLALTLPHIYTQPPLGDTTYVIGSGLLIHRDVFDKIGLLDERFFIYFEDAEFSMRARRKGVPVRFFSSPIVFHSVSQTTSRLGAPLLLRYHARNALLFNWLQAPWWIRMALPFWSFFAIILQYTKILLMPSRRAQSRAIAAGIVDFYARRFGKIS